ncbi:MAG: hypothetical protein ACOY90_22980 [Candidatus Zhuqueibacterota bacterium]
MAIEFQENNIPYIELPKLSINYKGFILKKKLYSRFYMQ